TAIVDGFRQALIMGADRVFTMDADYSHNPQDLVSLDRALEKLDLVIGSRYQGGIRILNWSLSRLLLSLGANYYVRILLRLKYTDCTSGFRAYQRKVVDELSRNKAHSHGYAFLVEVLNLVKQSGYRIGEIPIIYTERRAGQSKMSQLTIWEAAWRPWMLLLRQIMGRSVH
ncbi:MAG: polyprenol monophosphomannose synthase, partial [Candidatus Auribacterota bacterium]|nr:polyprenol monophosphomannose synthase [Candidatus Auribacterota bacterium]